MKLPKMPKFATEAEEAKWWFDHRIELADEMVAAIQEGRTGEGSRARTSRLRAEEEQQRTTTESVTTSHTR